MAPRWQPILSKAAMAVFVALSCLSHADSERLQLVASIRPLALLVQDIAGETADVSVLLPSGSSPHHYSLRVSDMQKIQAADLLIWLSPDFERFLASPVERRAKGSSLQAAALSGIRLPLASVNSNHRSHPGEDQDLHLWLNPDNGRTLMRAVAERLIELRPARAEEFTANLARAESALAQAVARVEKMLAPVAEEGFGVSHDGLGHFVSYFGLNQLGAVSVMPDQAVSARRMVETVQQLQDARCLVVEVGEPEGTVERLQRLFKIPVVRVDPLAFDPAIDSYAALIEALGRSFVQCLE